LSPLVIIISDVTDFDKAGPSETEMKRVENAIRAKP
jgi:hypothetical protein